ncbi:MAG: hypothetical protein WA735_07110 [Candidatus Acidiferrales bacterium]
MYSEETPATKQNSAAPRPDADFTVMIHPRLPKSVYEEIKVVARGEGLPAATWVRCLIIKTLRQRRGD